MRREVNLTDLDNKPPDIDELEIKDKVLTIIRMACMNNSIYRSINDKSENKRIKKRLQLISEVKEVILMKLREELNDKRVVDLCVARIHLDIIDDIFSAPEFISYKIERIYENEDILLAFGDAIPLRFRVEVLWLEKYYLCVFVF